MSGKSVGSKTLQGEIPYIDDVSLLEAIRVYVDKNVCTQAQVTKYIHTSTGAGLKRIRKSIKQLKNKGVINKGPELFDMRTTTLVCVKDKEEETIVC